MNFCRSAKVCSSRLDFLSGILSFLLDRNFFCSSWYSLNISFFFSSSVTTSFSSFSTSTSLFFSFFPFISFESALNSFWSSSFFFCLSFSNGFSSQSNSSSSRFFSFSSFFPFFLSFFVSLLRMEEISLSNSSSSFFSPLSTELLICKKKCISKIFIFEWLNYKYRFYWM